MGRGADVLRIHFTAEDLVRVRVADSVGVMAETYGCAVLARQNRGALPFRGWQNAVPGGIDAASGPLRALAGAGGPRLDLHTLAGGSTSVEQGADTLMSASRAQLRGELEDLTFLSAPSAVWVRSLADGDTAAKQHLVDALTACHRAAVAPHARRIRAHLDGVRAGYARAMLEGGVQRLMEAVCAPPESCWSPPVLTIRSPRNADVHLAGRGLVVAPTVFLWRRPILYWNPLDEAAAPVLSVPTVRDPVTGAALWADEAAGDHTSLVALVGRTRAAALTIVTDGACSTTELARHLDVSAAAASQHTGVLRNSGLITTRRHGPSVLHTITELGAELLTTTGRRRSAPRQRHVRTP
ncbi:transcriptional regulator [Streptomyces purpureus]|uniref:Transcriptional regulator n=1 Tax=Streptomyces purpureus TaxID=1951 RepID=A0A918HDF6_9ACTN|nr:transcriptional regulator [Streptomyces purpureus]